MTMRARRGEIGLVRLRSGRWGIRWGRALARTHRLAPIESTECRTRTEAAQVMKRRIAEVFGRSMSDAARETIALDSVVSIFLRDYAGGALRGRTPSDSTVDLNCRLLLGRRGLIVFARDHRVVDSGGLDEILVMRWLEARAATDAPDTIRLALGCAKRVAELAAERGYIDERAARAIRSLRGPPAARGRAPTEGVPGDAELEELLTEMEPHRARAAPYHLFAELQLRLGIRRAEVIALDEAWLDERARTVTVRVAVGFRTKDGESRVIDGVDPDTFALAREVIAAKRGTRVTVTGYKEAFRRACERLRRRGKPWRYRARTQALRSAHATKSRLRGIPLTVVARRLGHSSERTTERHYIGRSADAQPGPFSGVPRRSRRDR